METNTVEVILRKNVPLNGKLKKKNGRTLLEQGGKLEILYELFHYSNLVYVI